MSEYSGAAMILQRRLADLAEEWRSRCALMDVGSAISRSQARAVLGVIVLALDSASEGPRPMPAHLLDSLFQHEPDVDLRVLHVALLRELLHRTVANELAGIEAINVLERVNQLLDDLLAVATDRALRSLEGAAFLDPLTGAGNRRALARDGRRELAAAERHGRPVTLVSIDVDGLKRVNDLDGHAAGDELLRSLTSAIGGELRAGDGLYRIGGDEFVIVLPDTDAAGAAILVDRARATAPSFSMGVVTAPTDATGLEDLLVAADGRLLESKRRTRPGSGRTLDLTSPAAGEVPDEEPGSPGYHVMLGPVAAVAALLRGVVAAAPRAAVARVALPVLALAAVLMPLSSTPRAERANPVPPTIAESSSPGPPSPEAPPARAPVVALPAMAPTLPASSATSASPAAPTSSSQQEALPAGPPSAFAAIPTGTPPLPGKTVPVVAPPPVPAATTTTTTTPRTTTTTTAPRRTTTPTPSPTPTTTPSPTPTTTAPRTTTTTTAPRPPTPPATNTPTPTPMPMTTPPAPPTTTTTTPPTTTAPPATRTPPPPTHPATITYSDANTHPDANAHSDANPQATTNTQATTTTAETPDPVGAPTANASESGSHGSGDEEHSGDDTRGTGKARRAGAVCGHRHAERGDRRRVHLD